MNLSQTVLQLSPQNRGFHLITDEISRGIADLANYEAGLAHLLLLHTSASLSLNENADPDVRRDMESIFNRLIEENEPYYYHTLEGSDDMPAHAKSSILGASLTIPIRNGRFLLGTWQGIYLCEHRNHGGSRKIAITIIGEKKV